MIAITGISDRDPPEWFIAINGIRTYNGACSIVTPSLVMVIPTNRDGICPRTSRGTLQKSQV